MGSACSCFKSIREPIPIKNRPITNPTSKLKSIYPANMPSSSIKNNSDIHTKENFYPGEEDANLSENPSYMLKSKPLFVQKKKSEELIKLKKKENNHVNDNLQNFNKFAEPMVKLIKICDCRKHEENNSEYDVSWELDENRKASEILRFEEVAP